MLDDFARVVQMVASLREEDAYTITAQDVLEFSHNQELKTSVDMVLANALTDIDAEYLYTNEQGQ
jgi:hypothetical protein